MPSAIGRAVFMTLIVASNSNASEIGEQPCDSPNFNRQAFSQATNRDSAPAFKLVQALNFRSESYSETNKTINAKYTYPQGFYIEETSDLLYILRYSEASPARAIIEKYQWSTGKQIATYIFPDSQKSISEGLVVDTQGDSATAYIRSNNQLTQFQLVDNPNAPGTAKKIRPLIENVAQSFYRKHNTWYTEDFKTPQDETGHTRGRYSIYNERFELRSTINLSPQYSGYRESQKINWPKHQGFAVLDDGYVFTMGGHWTEKQAITPYSYFGINIFHKDGSISNSEYLSPRTLQDQLANIGIHVDRIENEGVQAMQDGTLITLEVVSTKDDTGGKLLFLQPHIAENNK